MTATIESFVERLKQDGIDAGRAEAERIIAAAHAQAKLLLDQAEAATQKHLAEVQVQATRLQEQVKNELILAARDVTARLRERLEKNLAALLHQSARTALADPQIIAQAIVEFTRAQVSGSATVTNAAQIQALALNLLGAQTPALGSIRLADGRTEPGFLFRLDQGFVIELDPASVTEHLMSLCGPAVREILQAAQNQ